MAKHCKRAPLARIHAADLPNVVRAGWTEGEFSRRVIDLAHDNGWLVVQFRPARTSKGWRTALSGDAGYPDLALTNGTKYILAELKVGRNKLTPEQARWIDRLRSAGITAVVWTPADYSVIVAVLTGKA